MKFSSAFIALAGMASQAMAMTVSSPVAGTVAALCVVVGTMVLRYWAIATLGDRWNTRVLVEPGVTAVRLEVRANALLVPDEQHALGRERGRDLARHRAQGPVQEGLGGAVAPHHVDGDPALRHGARRRGNGAESP